MLAELGGACCLQAQLRQAEQERGDLHSQQLMLEENLEASKLQVRRAASTV
jgi:hypothetical protein